MLKRRIAAASLAMILPFLATSCTGTAPNQISSASPTQDTVDFNSITVEGDATPTVKFPTPLNMSKTSVKVLKEGTSDVVVKAGEVTVNYLGVNGRTGETFDSSYDKQPAKFDVAQVVKGFSQAIIGQKVGSRVLVGITPADGYPDGSGDKIAKGDSLIFVIDIISAPELIEPKGDPIELPPNVPQVKMGSTGPTVTIPGDFIEPTEIVTHEVIKGTGKTIAAGGMATIRVRSFTKDGKIANDGWDHPQPIMVQAEGPSLSFIGKQAGTRMLMILPTAQDGNGGAPVPPQILVIDVLSAEAS